MSLLGDERHGSHLSLPGFGGPALVTLRASRVQVVGASLVGAPAVAALVRAGVGLVALDDAAEVTASDLASGLFPAGAVGDLRAAALSRELRVLDAGVRVVPFSSGTRPSVVLVCAEDAGVARMAAEAARAARLPHVVARGHRDGGHVVTVPVNGPCQLCADPPAGEGPCTPELSLALGGLAAAEVLLLLAAYARAPRGRCVVLSAGGVTSSATVRRPGCGCAR